MKAPYFVLERMAIAAWDSKATVSWYDFFRDKPEGRAFYIEQMRAALAVVRPQDVLPEPALPDPV
jgi:hypothetical protein